MPKAEVGSTKWLGNKMKAKGLQRLRWYCQVCERQMRDANGFKQHTLSEAHVRQMQVVGQNANKYINEYSTQFKSDFLQLLRTSHGEKKININHFYQEYISNKDHVHMNATKWPNLTEFAKYLGREGICRVEEGERGLEVSWIDNSPEALRRQAAIRKRERQDRGDEEREQLLVQQQVKRARLEACAREEDNLGVVPAGDGKRVVRPDHLGTIAGSETSGRDVSADEELKRGDTSDESGTPFTMALKSIDSGPAIEKPNEKSLSLQSDRPSTGTSTKPKNIFAMAAKKKPSKDKPLSRAAGAKPISEAERIMRDEMERKRKREHSGQHNGVARFRS